MCVCVCFCVILALFFFSYVKSALDRAHAVLSFSLAQLKKVEKISLPPPPHPTPHTSPGTTFLTSSFFCVSTADGANKQTNKQSVLEESDCFSSVPTKKPRQLSWIPPNSIKPNWLTEKKGMPNVHRSLRLSCFFLYRLPLVILF